MKTEILASPSYTICRVHTEPYETVYAESGAMAAMSTHITIAAKAKGGMMSSLKRGLLSGESFFVTEYETGDRPGFIDLAPALPGDVLSLDRDYNTENMIVTRGSWIANSEGITLDSKWGGFKNLFGGEGGFVSHVSGEGTIVLSCHGALLEHNLEETGPLTVDSGHLVAYAESANVAIRKAAKGGVRGVLHSVGTGEGLVFEFEGSGTVWTQTRNPSALAGWVASNHSHGN